MYRESSKDSSVLRGMFAAIIMCHSHKFAAIITMPDSTHPNPLRCHPTGIFAERPFRGGPSPSEPPSKEGALVTDNNEFAVLSANNGSISPERDERTRNPKPRMSSDSLLNELRSDYPWADGGNVTCEIPLNSSDIETVLHAQTSTSEGHSTQSLENHAVADDGLGTWALNKATQHMDVVTRLDGVRPSSR